MRQVTREHEHTETNLHSAILSQDYTREPACPARGRFINAVSMPIPFNGKLIISRSVACHPGRCLDLRVPGRLAGMLWI